MEDAKKKRLGTGRVAFLARKEDIKEKIEAGHTMVTVYEAHQKELGISYGQFVNYVNKFIRSKPDGNEGNKSDRAAEGKVADSSDKETRKPGYKHDATRGSKRNDLI